MRRGKRAFFLLGTALFFCVAGVLGAQSADELYRAGRLAYQQKMYSLAYANLTEFMEMVSWDDPRSDDASYLAALSALQDRDFPSGLKLLDGFPHRFPRSGYLRRLSYWKGVAFYGLEQYEEALAAFEEQLSYPEERNFYFRSLLYGGNSARLLDSPRTEELLRRLYREAREAGEDQYPPGALFHLADYLIRAGRDREAREEWSALILQYPSHSLARQALFLLAESLYQAGEPDEAFPRFDRLLRLYPDSEWAPQAAYRLVEISRERGDSDASQTYLAYLGELNPRGDLFPQASEMVAGYLLEAGDSEGARRIWESLDRQKAGALTPGSVDYHLALTWLAEGNPLQARNHLEDALSQAGKGSVLQSRIYQNLFLITLEEETGQALSYYAALRETFPAEAVTRDALRRAVAHLRKIGEGEKALALLREPPVSGEEDSAEWNYLRGEIYLDAGRLDEALAAYTPAAERLPEALYKRGYIFTLRREYSRADRVYRELEALDINPELTQRTALARGLCSYNLENYEEARRRFHEMVRLGKPGDPWRGEALYYRGRSEQKTGRLLASVESFREASGELGTSSLKIDALYQTGWSYLQMERYEPARKALSDLTASGQPGKIHGDAQILIGRSFLREGRWDEAVGAFEQIWSLFPPSKDGGDAWRDDLRDQACFRIAQTLLRAGRDEALAAYSRRSDRGGEKLWQTPVDEALEGTAAEALEGGQYQRGAALYEELLTRLTARGGEISLSLVLKGAYAYVQADRIDDAAELLLTGARNHAGDPQLPALGRQLASVIDGSRNADKSRSWLTAFRKAAPAPEAWALPGIAYGRLIADAAPEEAQALADELAEAPLDEAVQGEAVLFAGELALLRGDYEDAREWFFLLRESPLKDLAARARLFLGDWYRRRGDQKAAGEEWFQISLIYPECPEAPEALYRAWSVYREVGNEAKARSAEQALAQGYPESSWYQRVKNSSNN